MPSRRALVRAAIASIAMVIVVPLGWTGEAAGPGPEWARGLRELLAAGTPERTGPVAAVPANAASAIDLALWTENPSPRKGDLIELLVSASLACHLTLIGVDGEGRALVLFPNDLEPGNLIAPGVTVHVPGPASGYNLRLDRAGPESFIAICQRGARVPEGIGFDYEKQRFTVLGDWRLFLDHVAEKPHARNKEKSAGPLIGEDGPRLIGRAAITITVGD